MANLDKIITFFFVVSVVSSRNSFVDIINSKKKSKHHTLCIGPPWMWLCLTSGLYMYYFNHHQYTCTDCNGGVVGLIHCMTQRYCRFLIIPEFLIPMILRLKRFPSNCKSIKSQIPIISL